MRLGLTAFGGPAAHIAMMRREFVDARGWLSEQEFLDLLGLTNLIPGPNSTEMALHVGYRRHGVRGLLIAGLGFIAPAALLTTWLAWAYVRTRNLPLAGQIFYGIKPVIVAIVWQAGWALKGPLQKNRPLAALAAAAAGLAWLGVPEIALVLVSGLSTGIARWWRERGPARPLVLMSLACLLLVGITLYLGASSAESNAYGLGPLFLFFLKVGSVLYGSGYVLLAYLNHDLVGRWHWLTQSQLLDATAVGQFTPGPVFTTATFIGYLLGGPQGAAVATLGIFLPSFILVTASGRLLEGLKQNSLLSAFLDGVNAASLALLVVVAARLTVNAVVDPLTLGLAVVSLGVLARWKLNSAWLVLAGAAVGLALS